MKIPVFRKEKTGKIPILLTGIPGKNLQDYNLIVITSLANLEEEAKTLFRGFVGFSFLITIFAISLSSVFAQILLEPIEQLTAGLVHLSESHFSTRVKIKTGDELQLVGDGINEILEEMGELSIAKSIQEHLFPEEPLNLNRLMCKGWSRSHSEIGGEIFDYLGLSQDRVLLLMAGVSGHSIGSALVLAMTKMAVRTLVDLKFEDSATLFREMTQTLHEKIRGFEGGYMLVGVIDQNSGTISVTGNGRVLIGKTNSGMQGAGLDGVAETFLLSTDQAREKGNQEAYSLEMKFSAGERLFILSKGCWDASQPAEATNQEINRWFLEVGRVPFQALDTEVFKHLDFTHSQNKHESQTILMLERREG